MSAVSGETAVLSGEMPIETPTGMAGETTLLSADAAPTAPQFITCVNCNGQHNAQEPSCPYCGYVRGQ